MLYAAEYLNKVRDCKAAGFSELPALPVKIAEEGENDFDALVLPMPVSSDGTNINAPYEKEKLSLEVLDRVKKGGAVYAGGSFPALAEKCLEKGLRLKNYMKREELLIMNAVPTAEGTLEILLRELAVTVRDLDVLITGFGRVGEAVAGMLSALGAKVTVCARRPEQLAKAKNLSCRTVAFEEGFDEALKSCGAVINTVPAVIFDEKRLGLLKKETLLIDLASSSCIKDPAAAEGVRVIWALSLPGKTAPVTAGRIIGQTLLNMLKEEERDGAA